MKSNSQFFDELSDDYDLMIDFERALKNKISFIKNFLAINYKTALDLGCGTGADAIALSKLGIQVDAVDHSRGMLQQAMKNAKNFDADINFIESGLTAFNPKNKDYDFIVSLGNTIANINVLELRKLMSKISVMLNNGGSALLQIVNYAKLPESGNHILNVFENDEVSIIRKYKMNKNDLDFTIDKIDKKSQQKSQIITKLYRHSESDFNIMAKEMGFKIEFYGDLKKQPFNPDESTNLVVVLKK
ncbi:MAG: class I SAM-dependent methyltransferase [Algibacter sp.]|uniref:class I SAM-dependent DNA methyltransferase n=1 Tax=Algibacter sp. TaxID=1872428 RepID=UPI0026164A1F|nr:class I SAM-dependent methyltransferase [Algibacter sp.]MDG1728270.1 class I SAM-dependent methyltransferase [Algibacter sp.]MDG2178228.1 class I SAM-dependent methyltransferase [Algibacter sp.]